jgi:hypothetical protein
MSTARPSCLSLRVAAIVAALGATPLAAVAADPAASAPVLVAPAAAASADAVTAACERAVRQALPQAARAAEVGFNAAPIVDATASGDDVVVLRGAGRWRAADGMRSFNYRCNVDPRNPDAVGVVMRDTTPARAAAAAAPREADPDLTHLAPEACESSAAAVLKRRWPGVTQVSFDGSTRRLRQIAPDRLELRGQGRALPAAGMPTTIFQFECDIDPRDGRVTSARVSG